MLYGLCCILLCSVLTLNKLCTLVRSRSSTPTCLGWAASTTACPSLCPQWTCCASASRCSTRRRRSSTSCSSSTTSAAGEHLSLAVVFASLPFSQSSACGRLAPYVKRRQLALEIVFHGCVRFFLPLFFFHQLWLLFFFSLFLQGEKKFTFNTSGILFSFFKKNQQLIIM